MDEKIVKDLIDRLIDLSFAEDIGDGDHTTLSCIPADAMGKSKLLIKEEGILAGIEIAKEVFHRFDPEMKVEVFIQDGTHVKPGDVAMVVEGKIQSLLQTERLMLNIMQRMSGIATQTARFVAALGDTKTRLLDTRKTTPGHRVLDKYAVGCGGAWNHRIGLFDRLMLKDNHLAADEAAAGTRLAEIVRRSRAERPDLLCEVEVDSLAQIPPVLEAGADIILLDNFSLENLKKAVALIGDEAWTEISGGVSLETLPALGAVGADFVSCGALTHNVPWIDIGLDWD